MYRSSEGIPVADAMTNAAERFVVSGVCCATEEALLRKVLDAQVGAGGYSFNQITAELAFGRLPKQEVIDELQSIGFAIRRRKDLQSPQTFLERHGGAVALGAATLLGLAGFALEGIGGGTMSRALFLTAIFIGGWRVFVKAYNAARTFTLDMNVLMATAVVGAMVIDRWAEGAAVVILFGLSLALESYSMARTRRAIQGLMSDAPNEATVIRMGKELLVPSSDVLPGDILLVRPGERIGLDGVVIEGRSFVDQKAITGESMPVIQEPGSQVYAGSINQRGSLRILVTKPFEETVIARIMHLVEHAQENRAPVQTFVDRFARVYTPAVLVLAVLVALVPPLAFGEPFVVWFYRSLVLLVIACPCALVISTPVTIVSAVTCAARKGLLIKGGRHIEELTRVRAIAFDKTGTLTEGRPRVTDILPLDSVTGERALQLAAGIEYRSEHHVASAILTEAVNRGIPYDGFSVSAFESVPGLGVHALLDGSMYYLGNHQFCEEKGYCSREVEEALERLSAEGKTGVVLGETGKPLAVFGLHDTARGVSRSAIDKLKRQGVEHMVLLSGDNESVTRAVAQETGLENYAAGLLPEQKLSAVEDLKKKFGSVAMVGDGVNDAPALASSSVGIAMGVNGTDVALETADVILMSDDVGKLPVLLGLSRKAVRVIKQNIALALGLKLVFLLLTVSGNATLWMAVLADDGAALAVIFNGLRLLAYREES